VREESSPTEKEPGGLAAGGLVPDAAPLRTVVAGDRGCVSVEHSGFCIDVPCELLGREPACEPGLEPEADEGLEGSRSIAALRDTASGEREGRTG